MYASAYPFAASVLCLLIISAPCILCSDFTYGGSLDKGFQVSPSQISLQWGSYRPFLTSPSGGFSLGFENIENGYVLAIMYTIGPSNTSTSHNVEPPLNMEMVWSANGNSPSSKDAILLINQQGNLILSDASKGTLWSTGITSHTGPVKLFLQDSGNLILSNSTATDADTHAPIMWQSFDHPTDTLLQGQNFTASMILTSSFNQPASNNSQASIYFKMEVDGIALYADLGQNATQLKYWSLQADQETAVIDSPDNPIYARMNAMGYLGMYETENERVSFEVFETYNSTEVSHRRLKLDSDGNLRVYYWMSMNTSWEIDFEAVNEPCRLPSPCGSFGICNLSDACMCPAGGVIGNNVSAENASFARVNQSDASQAGGCVLVNAESFVDDGCVPVERGMETATLPAKGYFMKLVGVDSIFHAMTRTQLNATSVEACEGLCRSDCACMAFFYSKGSASKCFLAYQPAELSLVQTGNVDDVAFIRLSKAAAGDIGAPYTALQTGSSRGGRQAVVGPIIAAVASLLVACGVCGLAAWRYKARRGSGGEGDLEKRAFLSEIPGLPASVNYKEIEAWSDDFKRYRCTGSLGRLYEGTLAGGAQVAIARLSLLNQYDLHSVKLTLASVGRMTHPHLARLCCYAIDGVNLALCYELPPNGWLDLAALRWQQRVDVGLGVAQALAALHEEARMVHGLLNLQAVFIARGSEAQVAGVGVAELMASGLAAPLDAAQTPPNLAESADVLQFGVVLTQLLTGQRIINEEAATWRLRWRDAIGQTRLLDELLDPAIVADATCAHGDLVARLATSAGLCLHPSALQRPSMSTVMHILDGSLSHLPLI